jgi:hypothetical protein
VGSSAYSNVVLVVSLTPVTPPPPPPPPPPNAPTGLSLRSLGNGIVSATWKDASPTETQFTVERMINGVYQPQVSVGANVTTALVTGLKANASYTFRVKVIDAAGQAAYSSPANVNTF